MKKLFVFGLMLVLVFAVGARADVVLNFGNGTAEVSSAGDSFVITVDTAAMTAVSGEGDSFDAHIGIDEGGTITAAGTLVLTGNAGFGFSSAAASWDETDAASNNVVRFCMKNGSFGLAPFGAGERFQESEILWFEVSGLNGAAMHLKGYTLYDNNANRLDFYSGQGTAINLIGEADVSKTLDTPIILNEGDKFGWGWRNGGDGTRSGLMSITFDVIGGGTNSAPVINPIARPSSRAEALATPADADHPVEGEGIHIGRGDVVADPNQSADIDAGAFDPDGDELTYLWAVKEAPVGAVGYSFNDDSSATPRFNIAAGVLGDYILEVLVEDGVNPAVVGEVTVTVLDNWSPTGRIPDTAETNDREIYYDEMTLWDANSGDPEGDGLTYVWAVDPAISFMDATVEDPNIFVTSGEPGSAGDYELQLVISDGQYTTATSNILTVVDNVIPTVTADDDLFTSLDEGGTVQLAGEVVDDVYPKPYELVVGWTVLTQPAGATVIFDPDATAVDAVVTFDMVGEYVLQLSGDDGSGAIVDTVAVTVWPEMYKMLETPLLPSDDTFVRKNRLTNTHGGSSTLRVAPSSENGTCYAYLKFDIYGGVPGAVKSAKLRMKTQEGFVNTTVSAVSYGQTGEWAEADISWSSDDLVWGAELDGKVDLAGGSWYEFNVSGMALEADGKVTFGMKADDEPEVNHDWFSKESAGNEPGLVVAYDPNEAYGPLPIDGLGQVHVASGLSWLPGGSGVATNMVYLSTDPDPFSNPELTKVVTKAGGVGDPGRQLLDLAGDFPDGLTLDTTYYWGVNNGDKDSEVWSFVTMGVDPEMPISIAPADGTTDLVAPEKVIFQYDTFEGVVHDAIHLYVGSDLAMVEGLDSGVKLADVQVDYSIDDPNGIDARSIIDFVPNTEYFYRFEGMIGGESKANAIKSFSTGFYINVEGFEDLAKSGTVLDPVGVVSAVIATEARTGADSLQVDYAGAGSVVIALDRAHDWDDANVETLALFVRGMTGNTGAVLVTLEDASGAAATIACDVDVAQEDPWQAISIAVADFGIDLSEVRRIYIGVDGGAGTIYVDDIRLIAPVDETALLGFGAYYPFDIDGSDVSPANLDLTFKVDVAGSAGVGADNVAGGGALKLESDVTGNTGGMAHCTNATLGARDGITVSYWRKDGTMDDSPWKGMVQEGPDRDTANVSSKQVWGSVRVSSSRNRSMVRHDDLTNTTAWYTSETDGPDARDGKWHHMAMTYDAATGTLRSYVDGLLMNEIVETPGELIVGDVPMSDSDLTTTDFGIMIGAFKPEAIAGNQGLTPGQMSYVGHYDGSIDEVVLYTKALGAAEIDLINRKGVTIDADLNGDGVINLLDFAVLGNGWQVEYDIDDLEALLGLWLIE
ncbi:MAG: LamG domain-containing protein [Phycisphaerae bacterium]|nr:LamG domain-containing protein [Phycisphaerae bacterium]